MNLQAIIIANAFGLALLVSLLISDILTKQHRRYDDKLFLTLVFIFAAANIIEPITFWLDGRPGKAGRFFNLWGSVYLYAADIVSGFIWTMYVDLKLYRDRAHLKKMLPLYGFLPFIGTVALIVNIFRPFLFTVDENNVFRRLEWCWVMYVLIFITSGISVVIYYHYQNTKEKVLFFRVWLFMIPVIAGSLIQGLFYGVSTAWPGAAIGIAAIHMSLQNQKSFIDPLTGLYNRLFLSHTLTVAEGTKCYGIMLDLNYFKNINDRFGHSAGDRALNEAAKILNRAMFVKGSVYRYAGDEFVIILETDSESDVIETERRIREEADKYRAESNEPFVISFSMGHARLERDDTQDGFLRKIDTAMYIDKHNMHRQIEMENSAKKQKDLALDEAFLSQMKKYEDKVSLFGSEEEVKLPERYTWSNKGSYGKLLIIAGNRGCSGAGYLTAHAAFMAGTGMVKVLTCAETAALLNSKQPEAMTGVLFTEDGYDAEILKSGIDWADSILIGPGIGRSESASEVLKAVLASGRPLTVDADALNIIAGMADGSVNRADSIASLFTAPSVLTPHMGELSKLTGREVSDLKAHIFDTAYEYTYNNILTYVCKDARTVVASSGRLHVNTNGNPGMATAGSGDVLAGLIAGLAAAGMEPYEAARSGVYIHAMAGDAAAAASCEDCITAGDIAEHLPECISRLRHSRINS